MAKGIDFYRMAIDKFLGNSLISRLEKFEGDYLNHLKPDGSVGLGDWVDLSGLIAPHTCVSAILNDIESGAISSCAELDARFTALHESYYDYEWVWAYDLMLRYYNLTEGSVTYRDLVYILRRWMDSVLRLDRMLYEDAKKEFSLSAKTGFGFDGLGATTEADFEGVRGAFETNPFVAATTEHMKRKHNYAIVDEVDSVLIDDARTPLIISGPVPKGDDQLFEQYQPLVERLGRSRHG